MNGQKHEWSYYWYRKLEFQKEALFWSAKQTLVSQGATDSREREDGVAEATQWKRDLIGEFVFATSTTTTQTVRTTTHNATNLLQNKLREFRG